ncbi:MAG TPA: helix-turn-helix domain-containing protein [Lysobacter sp.]|nr:helix-turn-helix domain-containing protein [Lysobacter sp.]
MATALRRTPCLATAAEQRDLLQTSQHTQVIDMPLATTLRLLAKARGLSAADIATAIPRAGVATVSAWLQGDKLPGKEQLDALARTFGVPAGALLGELASTLDPARTKGEHELLAAYRALNTKQQSALLEVARSMHPAPARTTRPRSR